jgi:hypothetical protein
MARTHAAKKRNAESMINPVNSQGPPFDDIVRSMDSLNRKYAPKKQISALAMRSAFDRLVTSRWWIHGRRVQFKRIGI